MSRKHQGPAKLYTIRAYCSDCGVLLNESVPLTRRQLLFNWDNAVMAAPQIGCEKCNRKFPNWHINLKIYHSVYKKEFEPAVFIPKPKVSVDEMFANIANKRFGTMKS